MYIRKKTLLTSFFRSSSAICSLFLASSYAFLSDLSTIFLVLSLSLSLSLSERASLSARSLLRSSSALGGIQGEIGVILSMTIRGWTIHLVVMVGSRRIRSRINYQSNNFHGLKICKRGTSCRTWCKFHICISRGCLSLGAK